jgi:U2 small nuclear ribonucleoprotein B''
VDLSKKVEAIGCVSYSLLFAKTKSFKLKMDAPDEAPHHILFVQNLPAESTELMVQMLFQQFPGFKNVKLVEGQGIAFVEFAAIPNAEVAKNALQHFRVKDNHLMMISFAKQ